MRKSLILAGAICLLLSIVTPAYCINYNNWGNTDLYRLLGRELPYDLIYLGQGRGGVSTMVTDITEIPLGYSVVKMVCATKTNTLANGYPGQVITLVAVDQTGTLTISPASSTGWLSATMDANGETLTLYYDSVSGWMIQGYVGTTITLKNSGS